MTPLTGSGLPALTVPDGGRLAPEKGATVTPTVTVATWPLLPINPKVSRFSRPSRPWMWKPLPASLTLTAKVSVVPVAASAGSAV